MKTKLFLFISYSLESLAMLRDLFVSGEKWFFTYISNLIATKSIYSLCSYQHMEPFIYILLVMTILLFKFFFIMKLPEMQLMRHNLANQW